MSPEIFTPLAILVLALSNFLTAASLYWLHRRVGRLEGSDSEPEKPRVHMTIWGL